MPLPHTRCSMRQRKHGSQLPPAASSAPGALGDQHYIGMPRRRGGGLLQRGSRGFVEIALDHVRTRNVYTSVRMSALSHHEKCATFCRSPPFAHIAPLAGIRTRSVNCYRPRLEPWTLLPWTPWTLLVFGFQSSISLSSSTSRDVALAALWCSRTHRYI